MINKLAIVALVASLASSLAFAGDAIEGSWQSTGVHCQDGKAPQLHGMDVVHSLISFQDGKFAIVLPMEMNGQSCKFFIHGDYKVTGSFLYDTNLKMSGCGAADETSMPDDLDKIEFSKDGGMTITTTDGSSIPK